MGKTGKSGYSQNTIINVKSSYPKNDSEPSSEYLKNYVINQLYISHEQSIDFTNV